jgi:hypothetical protein
LAVCFEFAVESLHCTNQLVPLLLQQFKCHSVRDRLGSSINHLLAGGDELLDQLFALSCLFGTTVPATTHEGLRKENKSGMPEREARIRDADTS